VVAVVAVLVIALRFGNLVSTLIEARNAEALLLGVLGLTFLVAGVAEQLHVSAAVGAFLVGIAISGPVAHHATQLLSPLRDLFAALFFIFFGIATDPADIPPVLLPALALAAVTICTKVITGWYAARQVGIGPRGRWRAGLGLVPRGEFAVVIAGLAVGAEIEPRLAPLATAYVLITVVAGPLLARLPDADWFKRTLRTGQPAGEAG
jgi:CPA2 family monovalent cation:H+ antiporter-2